MAPGSILHADMDAFYASVEAIKDPTLRGRPLIVGGQGGRGVVTSASYEARTFGVHSAMPMVTARRLCPHAVFLPNDFPSYQDYSRRIGEVFARFTPLVEPLSLDEAFLDVSGSIRLFGSPSSIARRIKEEVAGLGLPCTVGVAPNKFLAKLASAQAKPDGLLVVTEDRIEEFIHPLPASALWGVGPQTADALERLGLKTVGDIARMPRRTLQRALGDAAGSHLWELAWGIDDRTVTPFEAPRSVGSEETFRRDLDFPDEILREILRLSDRTASRLRSNELCGRTVTLKVRFSNFRTITRSHTSAQELDSAGEIYAAARRLYRGLRLGGRGGNPNQPGIPETTEKRRRGEGGTGEAPWRRGSPNNRIRLLGVTVSGLASGPARRQLDLLAGGADGTPAAPALGDAAAAIDRIRNRFGQSAVRPAALLDGKEGAGGNQ